MFSLISNSISVLYMLVVICTFVYISIPFIIKFFPEVVVQGTFLNLVCLPRRFTCLHKPKEAWNLEGVHNHYVTNSSGLKLGVWHLLPATEISDNNHETEESLASAKKLVIYCHGNAWHRSFGHRKLLYTILRNLGFHVVTFDYRGYGDSEGWPSEDGVVEDTVAVYDWAVEKILQPECEILVWGHSLGTAIATQAVLRIQMGKRMKPPSGLVLEAPFTSAVEVMSEYPLSKNLARLYPGKLVTSILEEVLSSKRISFLTVDALPKLSNDTLILHAEDDNKVHFRLGRKLFEEAKKKNDGCSTNIVFVAFKAQHGLGHNGIWQHPQLPSLVENLTKGFSNCGFLEMEI